IHKNFIKYCIDPCKNCDESCCYGVRSSKNIVNITILQESADVGDILRNIESVVNAQAPPPYSQNEQLQIPENIILS
ncbi:18972_t:CDS:1, partial [Gigaspora margarita]